MRAALKSDVVLPGLERRLGGIVKGRKNEQAEPNHRDAPVPSDLFAVHVRVAGLADGPGEQRI
jgi:hypothetical protein